MPKKSVLLSKKPIIYLSLSLSLIIIAIGAIIVRNEVKKSKQIKYAELQAIAQLKVEQLTTWLNERDADAMFSLHSPLFNQEVLKYLEAGREPKIAKVLRKRLEIICTQYHYTAAFLTTPQGDPILGYNIETDEIGSTTIQHIRHANKESEVINSDFYYCEIHQRIHLDFIGPIMDDQKRVRAVLVFRVAPDDFLFPYLQRWPLPNRTGETLLIRQDGDSVVYLNNLRFNPESALKLRLPLTAIDVPAVQAILGRRGFTEGHDYRDVPVLAYIEAIPHTSWYLIAKIDKEEIFADVQGRTQLILLVIFSFLALVVGGLVSFFNVRQRGIYKALYQEASRVQRMEEQFRIIWENSRDGMRLCDGEGKIIKVNPAFCELVGLRAEELEGKPLSVIYDSADAARILAKHQERFLTDTIPPYMERLMKFHDGRECWLEVSNSLVWIDGKKLVLNIFRDITDRKRIQEELSRSESELRALFTAMHDVVIVADNNGQIIKVAPTNLKLLYRPPEEITGKSLSEIFPPDYAAMFLEKIQETLRAQTLIRFEYNLTIADKIFWFEGNLTPIKNGKVLLVARDITERKQAEEALRFSESRYRAIFEGSHDAMMSLEPPDWYFTSGNPAVLKVFMVSDLAQFIGLKPWELSPEYQPDGRLSSEKAQEMIQLAMQNGSHFFEWTHRRANGETFPCTVLLNRIDTDSKTFLLATIRDLTEEKRLQEILKFQEAQLRQTQKMEALGQLASGIAHDFNNILGIIMGHAALLKSKFEGPPKLKASLETIEKTSQRGADLVKHLLTLARKNEPITAPINLAELIRETVTVLKETFPRNIRIETKIASGLPYILADSTQIHQVLMNLCLNARDAMPNGGVLRISTEIVEKAALSNKYPDLTGQSYIRLNISDTGVGIEPALLERIFDPFYTTKAPGKGTGLGLSTVQSIVRNHDGFVEVASQPGEGSTFSVYLPVPSLPELRIEERIEQASVPVKGHETILLIEDEEPLIELLSAVMEMNGYQLLTAKNGLAGVEIYRLNQDQIDLVMTDMGLPGIAGDEVFRRIKQINPNVRVIIASGFIDPDQKSELLKAGVVAIIHKPYLPEEVLKNIREVLDRT